AGLRGGGGEPYVSCRLGARVPRRGLAVRLRPRPAPADRPRGRARGPARTLERWVFAVSLPPGAAAGLGESGEPRGADRRRLAARLLAAALVCGVGGPGADRARLPGELRRRADPGRRRVRRRRPGRRHPTSLGTR